MAFQDRIRLPTLNLIHRRLRLLNLLTQFIAAGHRLITVYAPGGYGKSILLADFTQTTDLPVCWCSLEPADRDPTSFLTLLAYSITDRFHEINADQLLRLVEQGDTHHSIRRIAALLAGVGQHVIIIDDYHKAVSAGLTLAINSLLQLLPPTGTLIVAARGEMTLETGQIIDLLVTERATGLSEDELRFTPDEVQLVMRKRFGRRILLNEAARIAAATAGNIAQILLAGHVMHAEQMLNRLSRQQLGDDQAIIYSYLADEVLARQPAELQYFLLGTAILPDMTAELCNALLDINNAQAQLEELVNRDLFIAQIGAGFHYHDLFAEFLRAKLAADKPFYQAISIKAARLLQARARFEEAVYLYLAVGAWDETAALLEAQGSGFYNTGRALTLNSWLAQIPATELARRPRLLLLSGQILANDLNQPHPALAAFEQAQAEFLRQCNPGGVAEAQVLQAAVRRMLGQPELALQLAEQGLAQLQTLPGSPAAIAYALRQAALANWLAGRPEVAVANLRQALELFTQLGSSHNLGLCHHELGICLEKQGNISAAHLHFQQALKIWEALGNANDLANTLNSFGVSLYSVGRYPEALEHFQNGLDIALQIGATRRAAFIWAGIGDVRLAQRQFEPARLCYAESLELARAINGRSLELYNRVKIAECCFGRRNLAEALKLVTPAYKLAAETGLRFEQGLAAALQAKILAQQAEFAAAHQLFAEAAAIFANSDLPELLRVRLWWGYALLLSAKPAAAYQQLRQAISLALEAGELINGLSAAVAEVLPLLHHFLHRADTPAEVQTNIRLLLAQAPATANPPANAQIFAFGAPYLVIFDRLRQFSQRGGDQKAPEFLLFLLLEGQTGGCRWDEVSAALWPDLDKSRASARFHQTLRRMRERLFDNADIILVKDDYYHVAAEFLQWCDALAFDALYRQSVAGQLEAQLELVELYRGEFLAGFELGDWGETRRARYESHFLQVAHLAAEQLLANQLPRQALAVIEKGLARDYFQEDLHRCALQAYAQLGLFDSLAEHYAALTATFKAELGAPPDLRTRQLYHQLLPHR